jgi:hypothetical protein
MFCCKRFAPNSPIRTLVCFVCPDYAPPRPRRKALPLPRTPVPHHPSGPVAPASEFTLSTKGPARLQSSRPPGAPFSRMAFVLSRMRQPELRACGFLDILLTGQYCHLHSAVVSVGLGVWGPAIPGRISLFQARMLHSVSATTHLCSSGASSESAPPRPYFNSHFHCAFVQTLRNHNVRRRVVAHRSRRTQNDQRTQSPRRPRHLSLPPGRPGERSE